MKNQDQWVPSKFVYRNDKLTASRDQNEVSITDRLIADIVASLYDEHLRLHAKGKLIDLGCGKVPFYEAYRPFVREAICVDWENTLHKNIYLDYECDLTGDLPFGDGEFDTILLSDVLEHIPEPEKLWGEMARILSPGGKVLLNVPFFFRIHESPYDFYRYTEFALKRFASISGFDVRVLKPIGGTPEILADLSARHVQMIPVIGKALAAAIVAVTGSIVKTAPGRRLSARTAPDFPFGYFMIVEKLGE